MYGNYREIGEAMSKSSQQRERIWLISKVNTNRHMKGFVATAEGAQRSVADVLSQTKQTYLGVWVWWHRTYNNATYNNACGTEEISHESPASPLPCRPLILRHGPF